MYTPNTPYLDHIEAIIAKIAQIYGITVTTMRSGSRLRVATQARQAAAWVLRQRFPIYSLQQIGHFVGVKDHTTVMYSLKQIEQRMQRDPDLAELLRDMACIPEPPPMTLYWEGPIIRPLVA